MFIRFIIELVFVAVLVWGLVLMGSHKKKLLFIRNVGGFFLIMCDLFAFAALCYFCRHSVFRVELPKGELHWTDQRPDSALFCVPAAYTDKNGCILGQYIKSGKVYGSLHPATGRVSIKDNIFYVDYRWLSADGFQQHTLVLDGKPKHFQDRRYKVRRALCKNSKGIFLVQSHLPITMNAFARQCARISTNAVNLDMGHCGYGYVTKMGMKIPLALWTYPNNADQSNWIYIK